MHIEKIKNFIEENNDNIFVEVYGNGYATCNYQLEINGERLTCYHECGEKVFSICENWFHHNNKGKHKKLSERKTGINIGFHYYEMGIDEKGKPFLYLYMLDNLQYQKSLEIYFSTINKFNGGL